MKRVLLSLGASIIVFSASYVESVNVEPVNSNESFRPGIVSWWFRKGTIPLPRLILHRGRS